MWMCVCMVQRCMWTCVRENVHTKCPARSPPPLSLTYSLETGSLTEPGARLASSDHLPVSALHGAGVTEAACSWMLFRGVLGIQTQAVLLVQCLLLSFILPFSERHWFPLTLSLVQASGLLCLKECCRTCILPKLGHQSLTFSLSLLVVLVLRMFTLRL